MPQGSVLSVTLFSLKINSILNQLPHTVHGNLYVDDLNTFCQGKDMRQNERRLQLDINRIIVWTNKNGFLFSADKAQCVHFYRIRDVHPDPDFFMNKCLISVSDMAKVLGVDFDKKIPFLQHILNLRHRCEQSVNILKLLSNTSWGADRVSLLKIYHAVIGSKIDYACQVYSLADASYLKKIDTVYQSALRICSGIFRISPGVSLHIDLLNLHFISSVRNFL